jgi:membrane protease YdiL (CAAX protease family)
MDQPGPGEERRCIAAPERTRAWPAVLVLLILAVQTGIPVLIYYQGISFQTLVGPAIVLVVLFRMALASRERMALHLALLAALMGVWDWAALWPAFWPFRLLVPVLVYGLAAFLIPGLRQGVAWLRPGRWDRRGRLEFLAVVAVSTAALWAWYFLAEPGLDVFLIAIPRWHPVGLALLALGLALLNAAIEEAIYRGVVMHSLEAALGTGVWSLLVQAVAFGALHLLGMPGGWIGVAMAAAYGVMLGWLRRRSQGMLAPYLAHVLADVAIFGILCAELAA